MRKFTPMPSKEYLNECFFYSPSTGELSWRTRPTYHFKTGILASWWNSRFSGKIAGAKTGCYISIKLDGTLFKAHRLIWKLMTGCDPERLVDHENTDTSDNRWDNLRLADEFQNGCNSNLSKNNSTGIKGVSFRASHGKYRASIKMRGKLIHIGYFLDIESAKSARAEAACRLHKEFANHGAKPKPSSSGMREGKMCELFHEWYLFNQSAHKSTSIPCYVLRDWDRPNILLHRCARCGAQKWDEVKHDPR